MPTRRNNNPNTFSGIGVPSIYSYDDFIRSAEMPSNPVRQSSGLTPTDIASIIGHSANASRRGSPFPSLQGFRALMEVENALALNVTIKINRRESPQGYADYLANKKGVYQFIKDEPTSINRTIAMGSYIAMRALRLKVAAINREARMYNAGELSRVACQTVRQFRQDFNMAQWTRPQAYTVVRWFENRKIEFRFSAMPEGALINGPSCLLLQWKEVQKHFCAAIKQARAARREMHIDPLASKPVGIYLQRSALKMLKVYKKPDENVRSVGIEIECFIPSTADMTKFWPVAQYVNVGTDGSIRPEGPNMRGVEFRVCAPAYKMTEVVNDLCMVLKDIGAKVNSSCGLHVHLDQRNQTAEEVKQTFTNFIRAQNLLMEVVPESRRDNHFCKKHRGTDFMAAQRGGRYKAINASSYSKHRTIEIRLFNGTINASKIIHWIKTLWAIEGGQPVLRCPKTFDIAQRYWRIDAVTLSWLKARQEKFKTITADNTDVMDAEPIEGE